mmetsp:Transcript_31398/g.73060  ORF Transcript_31398/g.73060 Transcript_31398/m.73060 type:complete len:225 (+) Transcript_31398:458-1132(+)
MLGWCCLPHVVLAAPSQYPWVEVARCSSGVAVRDRPPRSGRRDVRQLWPDEEVAGVEIDTRPPRTVDDRLRVPRPPHRDHPHRGSCPAPLAIPEHVIRAVHGEGHEGQVRIALGECVNCLALSRLPCDPPVLFNRHFEQAAAIAEAEGRLTLRPQLPVHVGCAVERAEAHHRIEPFQLRGRALGALPQQHRPGFDEELNVSESDRAEGAKQRQHTDARPRLQLR